MKIKFTFTAIIFVLVGGFVLFTREDKAQNSQITKNPDQTAQNSNTIPATTEKPNPVSLKALMQKEFDGREFTVGSMLENNNSYTRYFITYKSGELTISGIMNIPKGAVPIGGFPVLILNHGYIDPAIYTNGRGLRREQDYLAKQGFVIIHPDYRNHAESSKDEEVETKIRLGYVEDVINAVYAVKNSGLEYLSKEKFGMLGHSMGGGITQSVMVVKPDLIKAAVLYAPVSMDSVDSYNRWTTSRPEVVKQIQELHGSPSSNPKFWAEVSSKTYVGNIKTPVQIHHGDKDTDVPITWSKETENLLKKSGKSVVLFIYPGQPHEFTPPSWNTFMQRSAEFFKANIK